MSGRAQAAALDHGTRWQLGWRQIAARWWRQLGEAKRERQRRARARSAVVPMRGHLLRDIGVVEADAQRRGLIH